jgi:hypothetical protein
VRPAPRTGRLLPKPTPGSASTSEEDLDDKKWIYRDILGVAEYILFDPFGEYLDPPLMGFRLQDGDYLPMPIGRPPSAIRPSPIERGLNKSWPSSGDAWAGRGLPSSPVRFFLPESLTSPLQELRSVP